MKVFVSYGRISRQWAERLKADLEQRGIEVRSNASLTPDLDYAEQIEKVRQADAIILLIAPQARPDRKQSRTWQVALETVWAEPEKRLIPFLLGNAEPPPFVRSTVPPDGYLPVIRVRNPQLDWEQAIHNLVALLHNEADLSQVEQVPAITEADRAEQRQRRAELQAYIEDLKASANLPDDPAEWRARAMQR